MNGLGDQLLAGARFAGNENVGTRRRREPDQVEHLPHRFRLSDDVRVGVLLRQLRFQPLVFLRQPALLERLVHGENYFFVLERLGDVVEGTMLHGLDGPVDRGVGGDHDDWQIRIGDADGPERVDAADAGQHDVQDHQIDSVVGVEHRERFFAAGGHGHVEAFAAKHRVEDVAKDFLVVNDQNSH